MDTNTLASLPLEISKAEDKLRRKDQRSSRQAGHGSTTAGLALTRKYLPRVTEAFKARFLEPAHHQHTLALLTLLRALPAETVALCALQSVLHSVGQQHEMRDTFLQAANDIAAELWAAKLLHDNPQLAERISQAVRMRHSGIKQRRQAARSAAARAGFQHKVWPTGLKVLAGNWLVDVVVSTLSDVFELVRGDTTPQGDDTLFVTITEGAMGEAQQALREVILANPVILPVLDKPSPWDGWSMKHLSDPRFDFSITVVRTIHKDTAAAVKSAIKSGQMKPALDALNALQSVPWRINQRVLDVMQECVSRKIAVPGLPPVYDLPKPALPKSWEDMTDAEKTLWKFKATATKQQNRSFCGDRILYSEDMETALRLSNHDVFYTPMNCDWRGRVYALCHFNFQREDRVRALFEFAEGMPIGEEGLWWLKVHVANCGDFGKISKRPLAERVAWVDANAETIAAIAEAPTSPRALDVWLKADKPFLFTAACMELVSALAAGPSHVTRLPVSFDGSCSGLQHLCAMTRAPEGRYVNLINNELPEDVYQRVADLVKDRIAADDSPLAKACLAFGIDRKLVKRNVMTYSYSSKKFGMAGQQEEDLIKPLHYATLAGEHEEHPFGEWSGKLKSDKPSPAAQFLAKHTYDAIEEVVEKPAEAMTFLQKIARALAHESKPVRWTTPAGIPWINRYHEMRTNRLTLWLHDKGVKLRYDVKVADGNKLEIDKSRASNGVAPNFVHALDAAHLMLTVNASVEAGITNVATVHDSFGCLAPQAAQYNKIIRAEFVRMYEQHDVLSEVLEQAKCDLTLHNQERLPEVPERGSLNIEEVHDAQYAFA